MVEIKKELSIKDKVEIVCLIITALASVIQAISTIIK